MTSYLTLKLPGGVQWTPDNIPIVVKEITIMMVAVELEIGVIFLGKMRVNDSTFGYY